MSTSIRTLLLNPRPLRSLATTRRAYATIPTKNTTPTKPLEPSREQAMPIGAFYEAILNTPQPIPDVKPEEPASSVKEAQAQAQAQAPEAEKEPAKRGRKPKPKAVSSPSPPAAEVLSPSSEMSSPPVPTPPPTKDSTEDKAKVIFGSRLAGPAERAERLAKIREKSTLVAGVLVPPKPDEPDNCCMSGCVNCVWERFRDEMEEWALANAEAERRLATREQEKEPRGGSAALGLSANAKIPSTTKEPALHTTVSMDDDGGGSETNWDAGAATVAPPGTGRIAKDFWDDELYKNVPVGIREFMKQEKKLKEKHMREGTSGG